MSVITKMRIFLLGIELSKKIIGLGILVLVIGLVFVVPMDSLYTFPWFIMRWGAVLLVVSGLVWVARIESRKKAEREAGTLA
jgi:hypothetical protein